MKIQNISLHSELKEDEVWVFHTHGVRQAWGTCKLHLSIDCSVLKRWKPGRGLGKVIMKDCRKKVDISERECCKICWK